MEIIGMFSDTRPGKRSQTTNWKDPAFLMGKGRKLGVFMRFMGISWDFMEISFGLNGDFMGSLWDVLGKSQESSGESNHWIGTTSLNRKRWCFFAYLVGG